jgi:hypothetical protein
MRNRPARLGLNESVIQQHVPPLVQALLEGLTVRKAQDHAILADDFCQIRPSRILTHFD